MNFVSNNKEDTYCTPDWIHQNHHHSLGRHRSGVPYEYNFHPYTQTGHSDMSCVLVEKEAGWLHKDDNDKHFHVHRRIKEKGTSTTRDTGQAKRYPTYLLNIA